MPTPSARTKSQDQSRSDVFRQLAAASCAVFRSTIYDARKLTDPRGRATTFPTRKRQIPHTVVVWDVKILKAALWCQKETSVRKIYPYLFIATMYKYLTPEQLITYRGGDFAKIQWKDRPRRSRKRQNLYNRLVLEVTLGLGRTTLPAPNAAPNDFRHRTRSYTDLCPQVDHNPYLRLKMGEAMWMLASACVHQLLPALNFLVVRKNERFNIPRGGLFHWWAELYGTSRGYVEFCHMQQKMCVDLLDAGLLQIVVPPYGVLRGLGALGQARTIRDLVRDNKVDLLDEALAGWGISDRAHAVMDAQAILGETFGAGLLLQEEKVLAEVARNNPCADPSDPRNDNNWPLCVRCGAPCERSKTRAGENYPECDVTFAEEGHLKFVAGAVVRTRNFCDRCCEDGVREMCRGGE